VNGGLGLETIFEQNHITNSCINCYFGKYLEIINATLDHAGPSKQHDDRDAGFSVVIGQGERAGLGDLVNGSQYEYDQNNNCILY
jgi:hypothetical protein